MNALGIGIIGCGNISGTYLKFAPFFNGLDVRSVADINSETASARAKEFGVRAESVEDLLKAPDIDIIVNLTVPGVHYEVNHSILQAGKHVYCEKPFVLSLEEGQKLRDFAAAKNLWIGSAPDTFLGGAHQHARALIDENSIGAIIGGTCHVMSHGMEHWHPNPDFFFQPGGGPVLDLGPYYISNLIQLIGPVRSVAAMAAASFPTRTITNGPRQGQTVPVNTPTNIHALLEFQNGAIVTFGASWDVWNHAHPHMELYGTGGTLSLPDPNFFGGEVLVSKEDSQMEVEACSKHPFAVPNEVHADGRKQANYRCAGLADMAAAIAENRPHRCNADLALHAVDVMASLLHAGEKRQWTEMTTTCERPAPLTAEQAYALMTPKFAETIEVHKQ